MISDKLKELEEIDKENNYRIFKCRDKNNDNKLCQLKYMYYDDKLISDLYFQKYNQLQHDDNVIKYR